MYLKSLEVHGFKSFANKLVFEFHHGITAIVGPNGSGKSNVADAVRWVLGEQSARQLRGAKMEDVIFAGTEMRKPLGFAYVAITINNEDHKLNVPYEEVKIARRVYRSGESEYLLNGASCRLKDVQELLFDTGIGKEGYSIIGQGQIDKILSGKYTESNAPLMVSSIAPPALSDTISVFTTSCSVSASVFISVNFGDKEDSIAPLLILAKDSTAIIHPFP